MAGLAGFLTRLRPAGPLIGAILLAVAVPLGAALGFALGAVTATPARAEAIPVVAAENFYGDVARQIGGSAVAVTSILANPDQDPHLFEARASVARAVANARIVIMNGLDYDPWMTKLLAASPRSARIVIEVAALMQRRPGDNPHLWYDPATMPAVADALAARLTALDPDRRADYAVNLTRFHEALLPLDAKVAALKQRYAGTPVTATEPVAGYLLAALNLGVRNQRFQLSVMNGTEPSASDIGAFQRDLEGRAVRVLLYNNQTVAPLTERMRTLAAKAGIPVVGVSETAPDGTHYQDWMLAQLGALEAALAGKRP
ncbi:MAG: metal ABC transporter solute-binding protein, Zn/Mn family [Candidatus Eiseniibacteriota bacterium]